MSGFGGSRGWGFVRVMALLAVAAVQAILCGPASAQVNEPPPNWAEEKYGWREAYGGFDAARDQWLAYSGMTFALQSADIYSNGLRLRLGGGYGRYGYDSVAPHANCGVAVLNDICNEDDRGRQHIQVAHSYAEVLLGYYVQLGRLTAKAFAGASMSSEQHLKHDPNGDDDGTHFGIKGALELWLTINEVYWTSLDLSYSTARDESSARWRSGWRLSRALSIGPELRYDKNIETGDDAWNGRAGLFTRYEWTGGELSVGGGGIWRVDEWSPAASSAYGNVNVLFQY